MKRITSISAAMAMFAVTFFGCCPCRHIATGVRDSVRVEVRERVEYIRDTVEIAVPVESTQQVVADSSHLETNFAVSDARITFDGRLFHSLCNKPQNVPVETKIQIIHRDSIVYRDRDETNIIEVPREFTTWQRIRLDGFWVLLALFLVILKFKIS